MRRGKGDEGKGVARSHWSVTEKSWEGRGEGRVGRWV